ncbi:MAG: 6-bladed beta-propeller [Deltaproteobacteria bacterium]|nr:6-bladed beta-propeller [Candidatus Anaeroferrophillus wilburensis]MBN2888543.1 6-bladed beta-propeller [Deltaproteobacteria bacterium]
MKGGCGEQWRCILFLMLFMLASCSTGTLQEQGGLEPVPVWPAPPAAARIVWVEEVSRFQDICGQPGFWQRLKEVLVGKISTGMVKPYGIYIDEEQRLYVVDSGSGFIHLMDPNAGCYRAIPGPDDGLVLPSPIGVAGDDQGQVFITDSKLGKVYRYLPDDGSLQPLTRMTLKRPAGIAYHRLNRLLYVAEAGVHQVVAFDRQGIEQFRFGSHGKRPGEFNFPTAVCVDQRGQVLVTDALNARVQIFTPEGQFVAAFGEPGDTSGTFAKPKGVAVDSEGHVYVCDALFDAVQIFDQEGRLLLTFGQSGSAPGEFWMPSGISIDSRDYIYVADSYNRRVQVFRYVREGER